MRIEEKTATRPTDTEPGDRSSGAPGPLGRRPFQAPRLTRHEPLVNITLLSNGDWGGSGSSGGTFFG